MDIDIVYVLMITVMILLSLHVGVMAVTKGKSTRIKILSAINITIPVLLYILLYHYGIINYNNKRTFAGGIATVYLISMIVQYILISKEKVDDCDWIISTKKYNTVKDTVYRFIYMILMLAVPIYLTKSGNIILWGVLGPLMIPIFLYMSSYLLGLGVDGDGTIIDAGDYYGTFVRGIDDSDDYVNSGLMMNILRSIVRGIILIVLFIISFLVSKKISASETTSPSSIITFLIIISGVLPLILGYLIEPKCLLKAAKKKDNEGIKCLADKHGGLYGYLMYIIVCGIIIIVKDN